MFHHTQDWTIAPAQTPGTIKASMLALRLAISHERDTAAIVLRDAAKAPSFKGQGEINPNLGNNIDLIV